VLCEGGNIMVRRHDLTDAQFALLEPYLPPSGTVGHPWDDHRPILNGIFWKLHTGAQWRDIPERYGPWSTLYDRQRRWCQDGTWDRILTALQVPLDASGQIDWDHWWIDRTNIRATRAAAGARKKGGLRPNRPTTHAAAPKAGLAPSSTS
jgi:transposase